MTGQKLAVCSACNWQGGRSGSGNMFADLREEATIILMTMHHLVQASQRNKAVNTQAAGNLPALICSFDFNSDSFSPNPFLKT